MFDPDAAAVAGSGIFGLPFSVEESHVVVLPVPFEATTSYGGGASEGPAAVLEASRQVDLHDHETGRPYERGIAMQKIPRKIVTLNRQASALAKPVIEAGGAISSRLRRMAERVNAIGSQVNELTYQNAAALLDEGKMVAVLGGDHSVPFGAIRAYGERYPGMGILHLDAHADLRNAYEDLTWSHASIFYNVMTMVPNIRKLVQVGVRDLSGAEARMIRSSKGRIETFFDSDLAAQKDEGVGFARIADRIISALPDDIYLSWDIDGLDPTLCPHTGTPVPGGLSWNEAIALLRAVVRSGKRIIGLDLCEVAPGDTEWDANVGARMLYKMIGFALLSQGQSKRAPGAPSGNRRSTES